MLNILILTRPNQAKNRLTSLCNPICFSVRCRNGWAGFFTFMVTFSATHLVHDYQGGSAKDHDPIINLVLPLTTCWPPIKTSYSPVKWITNCLIQVGATIRYNKLCTPNLCFLITLRHNFSAVRALPAGNKLNCLGYLDRLNLDYLRQTQNLGPPPQHYSLFICRQRLARYRNLKERVT